MTYSGRDFTKDVVIAEVQVCKTLHVAYFYGNGAVELVRIKIQTCQIVEIGENS